jgi:hypothetical protein
MSQAKLFVFISFHSVARMQYQEIAFAVCADGQFDDARKSVTRASFTAFQKAMVEATGQISDVVARETPKQFPRSVSSQETIRQGNEKFIARRSRAMSATQNGCIASNSFHLSHFAKRDYVNRLLLSDSGMAGCRANVSLLLCRRRRVSPRPRSTFPLKLPRK